MREREDFIVNVFLGLFGLLLGLFIWRKWSQLNLTAKRPILKPMSEAEIVKATKAFLGKINDDEKFREITDTTISDIYPDDPDQDVPRQ